MTTTVREQALERLVANFTAIQVGQPAEDPYQNAYFYVRRNPLDEDSWKKTLTMGVHDTADITEQGANFALHKLRVVLEFRLLLETGQVASTIANEILGEITRKIWEDKQLGGLVIDVIDTSNELYIDDFDKRQISGAVYLTVQYRVLPSDPRVRI